MPNLRVHTYIDRLFFGRSYWRIHRRIDAPFKSLGRCHRELFHDAFSAYSIALEEYPDDSNAIEAALTHIIVDELCSRDASFKKTLETLATQYYKKRKTRKNKRRTKKRGKEKSAKERLVSVLSQLITREVLTG